MRPPRWRRWAAAAAVILAVAGLYFRAHPIAVRNSSRVNLQPPAPTLSAQLIPKNPQETLVQNIESRHEDIHVIWIHPAYSTYGDQ